ncbi:MAG: histone deacetylase [Planctomycetota bacterium]
MSRTGLISHSDCLAHDTGVGHPERADRLRAVLARLEESGLNGELDAIEAPEADLRALAAVHPPEHVQRIEAACARGAAQLDAGDTAVSPGSFRAARLAAGGVVEAVRRVWSGAWRNAFVAVRPPGHHAERDIAMGFCLFNSVAVAARALQAEGAGRVAILDWDVHHGNGTQHLFEADPTVFYASLHQWPLYPGTGAESERGLGDGEGTTLNRPMPAGSGDAEWLGEVERSVLPALEAFAPDFLLLSAGFDAHRMDPLGACVLTTAGYAELSRRVAELAASCCEGRIVSVLEGGYHLDALAESVEAHVGALRGATA